MSKQRRKSLEQSTILKVANLEKNFIKYGHYVTLTANDLFED